jgi:RNA polymerase sigma-70 factor (ECF subfamily)
VTDDSFAPFFRQRYHRTVLLLMTMGASRSDAEDATQDAMTAAWRQWEDIREPAAWVRTAALRAWWKHNRRQPVVGRLETAPQPVADDPEIAVFAEEQRWVIGLLRVLAPQQRTVAALFYDGMTVSEIAELTGRPTATVRSHLRYARNRLKEMIVLDCTPTTGAPT